MSSYESLIELQTDIKSFEDSVDNHISNREKLLFSLLTKKLDENSNLEIKLLDLKKESEDLKDMITTLEKSVLDFYVTYNVPGMKDDAESQKDNIERLKLKLNTKEDDFNKFFKKYKAIEKNIQVDNKKYTMYYFIFIFWIILLCVFLYICFKIYTTNTVPSITFYLFFIAGCISIYYIYLNLKMYIDI
jgi:hypothetical protein